MAAKVKRLKPTDSSASGTDTSVDAPRMRVVKGGIVHGQSLPISAGSAISATPKQS